MVVSNAPSVAASVDPFDDYLLSLAVAGTADFLVTGDKQHLLAIGRYRGTRIVTVRDFLVLNNRLP